ncbi:hypothetical protein CCYA_CCYA03G1026 [Cyanidiococcus yangmingshanensis]|uniref:Prefoldin subunit beta n=1 Tax=Cyanidiococcus yangmingshanensis TaxID=2690220 RepID=A0A7J7INW3_9RHOD|nr:hypothetical protein F1559_002274 [Cyanidiococcus yangmingshanensis]KAK4530169.1 hypothetical protein CCYA_CCYA03G1026 [Cyanidiococcus yangmingshanensis]
MQAEHADKPSAATVRSQLRELERRVIQVEAQLAVAKRDQLLAQAALDTLHSLAPGRQAARSVGKCFLFLRREELESQVLRDQEEARQTLERLSELKRRFEEKLVASRETLQRDPGSD